MSKKSFQRRVVSLGSLVPVSVGDRIRAVFRHLSKPEEREKTGLILEVRRRYGHHGNFVRTAPLLYVKIDGQEEPQYFDQSYVVEVLDHYHGPQRLVENVFRAPIRSRAGYWYPLRRGVWEGDLVGLISHVLSNHHARITHPLDSDKLKKFFAKDRPGYVAQVFGVVVVRAKPFKRWVNQNYSKFLATTAELDASSTESNEYMSKLVDDDLDDFGDPEGQPQPYEGSCYDD